MMWRIVNSLVCILRLAIGIYCLAIGNLMAGIYGAFEVWSSWLSIINLYQGKDGDFSWRGFGVLLCYFCGSVFVPDTGPVQSEFLLGVEVSIAVVRLWCLYEMGACYTGGLPSWVRLCDTGPFAVIRHPLAATGILIRWVCVAGNPTLFNLGSGVLFTCGVVLSVWLEESYLREGETWRTYAGRVKWRLIPDVY